MGQVARRSRRWIVGFILTAGMVHATPEDDAGAATGSPNTNDTVITSKNFEYDARENRAIFEGNVIVFDSRLSLRADKMWVLFTENHKVSEIRAIGKEVKLYQAERSAGCRQMEYDVAEGKMTLRQDAWVKQPDGVLRGSVIHMWRDDERITSESNVTFRVFLDSEGEGSTLFPGVQ